MALWIPHDRNRWAGIAGTVLVHVIVIGALLLVAPE